MIEQRQRIALKEHVELKTIKTVAYDLEWSWQDAHDQTEDTPFEIIWLSDDRKTGIHYIEDHTINVRYLLFRGADAERAANSAATKLAHYTWAEVQSAFHGSTDVSLRTQYVYYAAILTPKDFSKDFFSFFEEALKDGSPNVRRAAIYSLGYVEWDHFVPILELMRDSDPDDVVRNDASAMLKAYEKHRAEKTTKKPSKR